MPEVNVSDEDDISIGLVETSPARVGASGGTHPKRTKVRITAAALVVSLAFVAVGTWWFVHKDDLGKDVAFRAFGEDVTKADVIEQSSTLHALYGVEKPTNDKDLKRYWRDLAKSMALARVVEHAAKERQISVRAAEAQKALDEYINQYYGQGAAGRTAFIAALGNEGTSEPAVLKELTRQLLVSRLYDDVTKSVAQPTAAEVSAAYKVRSCELKLPEQRRILNIVTVTRADAVRALNKIKHGEAFTAVAKTDSADQSTSSGGGDLGLVSRDQLEKAYGDDAFSAKTGELFGPVQTRYGWNIGQVVKIEPALVPSEAKSSEALTQILLTEARSKVWQSWIHNQLKQADVTYAASYTPADPFAAPDPVATTSKAACD